MTFSLPRFSQPTFIFFLVWGISFLFALTHLTHFITADEHYWIYERIPQYWQGWDKGQLKKTFINDKPGVSLALITGPALFFAPPTENQCLEGNDRLLRCDTAATEKILLAFRLPLVLFNGVILLFLFWILRKLTNPWIALWSTTLIGLSPPLLGITQIVNPDALLWSTGAAALFSFYALLKYSEKKYLIFAVLFTALALLTKYTALILLPFYAFLVLAHFLARPDLEDHTTLFRTLSQDLRYFFLTLLGVGTLTFICLPALALDPTLLSTYLFTVPKKQFLFLSTLTLGALVLADFLFFKARFLFLLRTLILKHFYLLRLVSLFFLCLFIIAIAARFAYPGWHFFSLPFDLKDISDAKYYGPVPNSWQAFFLEWQPLVFSLTPITLLGLLFLWMADARRTWPEFFYFSLSLPFLLLLYVTLLVRSNVLATPRYLILLFPLFGLLSAVGFWYMLRPFSGRWHLSVASIALLVFSVLSLGTISPYLFNYANSLLPKQFLTQDAWGYGGYEAAQYLNQKPGAQDLIVWSDYYGFCEFFVGKCLTAYTYDGTKIQPDYYVLTRRGKARYMSRFTRWERLSGLTAYKYYDRSDPEWTLTIDGRPDNFVKVYKVEK